MRTRFVASLRIQWRLSLQASSHLVPQYVPRTPKIMPETPSLHIASPFSTTATWQQTYALQFTTGTHTPSNPTMFNSTASGTFQYNSTPYPSSRRSKKRSNNENTDTPAPKRLRKTLASSTPLLTIPSTNFNANATTTSCESIGGDSSIGNDTESHKLARFFAFLRDDLK